MPPTMTEAEASQLYDQLYSTEGATPDDVTGLLDANRQRDWADVYKSNTGGLAANIVGPTMYGLHNLTGGLADEGVAGGTALLDAFLPVGFGGTGQSVGDAYNQRLSQVRGLTKGFEEENPVAKYAVGLPTMVAGATQFAKYLPAALQMQKNATVAQNALALAGQGGAFGLIDGFGSGEGGTINRLKNSAISGGINAVLSPAIGGTLQMVADNLAPFTARGVKSIAGKLYDVLMTPAEKVKLSADVAAGKDISSLGAQRTLAEMVGSPKTANMEGAIGRDMTTSASSVVTDALAARQELQRQALLSTAKDAGQDVPIALRGKIIQRETADAAAQAHDAANDLFKGIEGDIDVVQPAIQQWGAKIKGMFKGWTEVPGEVKHYFSKLKKIGNPTIPPEVQEIYKQEGLDAAMAAAESMGLKVKPGEATRSAQELLGLHEEIGREMEKAAAKGDKKVLSAFKSLYGIVFGQLDLAAEKGLISEEARAALLEAKNAKAKVYGAFDDVKPVARMINPNTSAEEAARTAIKDQTTAEAFMAAAGHRPEAVDQAKGALIDAMTKKPQHLWPKFFAENRGTFKALWGDEFGTVEKGIQDILESQGVGQAARSTSNRQSATAQNFNAAAHIGNNPAAVIGESGQSIGGAAGGLLGFILGGNPVSKAAGSGIGYLLGSGLGQLGKGSQSRVISELAQMATDPRYAIEAMNTSTIPQSLAKIFGKGAPAVGTLGTDAGLRALGPLAGLRMNTRDAQKVAIDDANEKIRQRSSASRGLDSLRADRSPVSAALRSSPSPANGRPLNSTPQLQEAPQVDPLGSSDNSGTKTRTKESGIPSDLFSKISDPDVRDLIGKMPPLVQAIISVESKGDHKAVSKVGARGLMQLMPANQKKLGVTDANDPQQNITAGSKLLAEEIQRYDDPRVALAAYNAGSPKVNDAIKRAKSSRFEDIYPYLPDETKGYVHLVLTAYNKLNREA